MNLFQKIRFRFTALFQKEKLDAEMDVEIRSHIEMRALQNIDAGMTPDEARRAALRQFGGVESVKEACREQRGIRWIEFFFKDLLFSIRTLRKNPGFTLVTTSSLTVGLTLAAITLATVNAYLLRSLPYPAAHRVYHVMYAPPGPYEPGGMTEIDWNALDDVVSDAVTSTGQTFYLVNAGPVKTERGLQVSPGFIRGLGVQAFIGRTFAEEEFTVGSEDVAMIGHALWRDHFGADPQIIGRELRVTRDDGGEQTESLRIVGVLPQGFWFGRESASTIDILTPLRTRERTYMVRLQEGVPVAHAERRITDAARSVGSDFRPDWRGVHLQSVHQRYVENIQPVLVGVTLAVGVVLALVYVNVAILVLLRAMRRQKEVVVRVALGAEGRHILRMLVAEISLVCGVALVASLALSSAALRLLMPVIETQLGRPAPAGPSTIQVDSSVLLALCGVSLLTVMSLALLPALTPWQRRLANALRSQGANNTDAPFMRRLRKSLIALEVGGALVLLVGCGLMVRSAINLANTDLGFNPEQVMRIGIRLPNRANADLSAQSRFFTTLLERLPQVRDSQVALMSAFPPFYPANQYKVETGTPRSGESEMSIGMMRIGAGYFDLYDTPLKFGREFTPADRMGSEPVAVISETLARQLWQDGNALGRQVRVVEEDMPGSPFGPWRTVVGVVGDIRQGYDDPDLRDVYIPFLQAPGRFASLHVKTTLSSSFWEQSVGRAAADIDRYVQVGPTRVITSEDRQRTGANFLSSMLTGFSVFAALLAILGIYGVTSYAVQQREREIAIRITVGASKSAVVRLFLKENVYVLTTGLGLGLVGTLGAAKVLENRVYGVQPFDLVTILSVCALMAAVGLLTTWLPARRGATRDPVSVLKEG